MREIEPDAAQQLREFFEELESLVLSRKDPSTRVTYRPVDENEVVDDSLPSDEETELIIESPSERIPTREFQSCAGGPVAAVDCGVGRLGETEDGVIVALRATVVVDSKNTSRVSYLRSGPIYLHNRYRAVALYLMGKQLGKDDFFVELDKADPDKPVPVRVKAGVADNVYQYGDRFRNWLERVAQRIAVSSIENGTILFDGALTLGTRDTPATYLRDLAALAGSRGNSIIAISKRSQLQVGERPVRFWLDDSPHRACHRLLTPLLAGERGERVLGNVYAVRFSPLGPTFRMDVKPASGQSDYEAINGLYNSAAMRGGYPDIQVRAHAHSYFTYPDIIQLQAQAGARYGLTPQGEIELSGIFAPFGGRFK